MQKFILKLPIFILLLALTSCNFHTEADMDDMPDMPAPVALNLNYPAAFVVNGESNDIGVINLNDLIVRDHISLNGGTFPHHIYLSPDKTRLAVAITSMDLSGGHGMDMGTMGGYKVVVLNSYNGTIEKEIPLPKMPHNAVFNSNGSELWIAQEDETQSQILVYNTGSWSLNNTILVGKGLSEVTFSADGTKVFAANTTDATVSIINPTTKTVIDTVPVGKDPVGAWPASNGFMYVDNETDQSIMEISIANHTVTDTIPLGFKPGYVAYHPGAHELWVSDASNGSVVYFTNINGKWTRQEAISTGADTHAIVFSADGTKAFVTNQGANTVSVLNVADHQVIKTVSVGKKPNGLVLRQ